MFDTVVSVTLHTHVGNGSTRPCIASDEFSNDVKKAKMFAVSARIADNSRVELTLSDSWFLPECLQV
jgi:hypothetical protein